MDDQQKDWNRKAWTASFLLLLTVLALMFLWFGGCDVEPKKKVIYQEPTDTNTGTDDGGDDDGGDDGDTDTDTSSNTGTGTDPRACDTVTTYDELQPVIGQKCAGCHNGYDRIETARDKIDAFVRRINLPPTDAQHMPKGGNTLSVQEKNLFSSWKADGLLGDGDCIGDVDPPLPFMDFAAIEDAMFRDIATVSVADQKDTRYLVFADRIDIGASAADIDTWRQAAVKAVNSVSVDRNLHRPEVVGPGVLRINISDLKIDQVQWKLIEDSSLFQFESFTARGVALKQITGTRLPWFPVSEFNDTVLRNAPVYYNLTRAPQKLQELTAALGVDFAGDLANFRATLVGFNGSPLSPSANRLMSRHDSDDGYFWATYDTGPIVSDRQNIFKNPLLVEAGGQANLQFAAGEQLYSLPNGLMGSYLADGDGNRLNAADANVVHDFTTNPLSPIIRNAISCFRCHSGGLIRAVDQVRPAVSGPGNQLGADDAQRALALFDPQATVDAILARDNQRFGNAMRALGLDPTLPDPITRVSDRFLGDQTLAEVAAQLYLRPGEFATLLGLSAEGKAQAGQLLADRDGDGEYDGTISHDQLVQVLPILKRDLRLFQDPLSAQGGK